MGSLFPVIVGFGGLCWENRGVCIGRAQGYELGMLECVHACVGLVKDTCAKALHSFNINAGMLVCVGSACMRAMGKCESRGGVGNVTGNWKT